MNKAVVLLAMALWVVLFASCKGMPAGISVTGEDVVAGGELKVLALNLWQEGTQVEGGLDKIAAVIAASDADVVALSEVRNYKGVDFMGRLRQKLIDHGAWYRGQFVDGDVAVLSRYEITRSDVVFYDPKRARGSLVAYWIQHPTAGEVVVAAAHLDYKNYAIYLPRGYDGNLFTMIDLDGDREPDPVRDLARLHAMDAASGRDDLLLAFLDYAKVNGDSGAAMILAGDFNECSHLDWTEATKDLYSHNGVVIEWKNSLRLYAAGFRDAWRERYPNPVTHPGATWPSEAWGKGSTSWTPKVDERDRIDFVYFKNSDRQPWRVEGAWVVGSSRYYVYNELRAPLTEDAFFASDLPWPSDHKGVLVTLAW